MIAGKEYKAEKIAGEPNNYMVTWGDESYKWEPFSFTPDYLAKEGPAFYDRWTKPGLIYPWDVSLEDRQKWDSKEVFARALYQSVWFAAREYEYSANHPSTLFDAKGGVRIDERCSVGRGYFQPGAVKLLPKDLQGVLGRKYLELWFQPDDVAGMGLVSFSYITEKADDTWFYSPSVRKVRRFSEGSRQDFLSGSTYRNEDFVTTRPIHNYKVTGNGIYCPNPEYFGYPQCERKFWTDEKPKRFTGEGEPCWILEETPYKEPWWFTKQIRWIDMKSLSFCLSEAYDSKGRKTRYMLHHSFMFDPVQYPLLSQWQMWTCKDFNSGFMSFDPMGYGEQPGFPTSRFYYNQDFPEDAFGPQTLLKEHKRNLFWK